MPRFNITRIHTPNGIFRLTGHIVQSALPTSNSPALHIKHLDILGTDGWIALNIATQQTQALIHLIEEECIQHIQSRQKP
ncbi:hypothetical protein [uncultured Shewanella sp.]|uniref:hypothetical protein n=1 Tax=uncultured Shewanella sp. TaxID=173975 RepID=UPI002627A1F5|nr:hypothetical protein [uncultured Shewanella sp.]